VTREQRLAILGADTVAAIHARVKRAPKPTDEVLDDLRRILTNPGGTVPVTEPIAAPAPRAA
jgi:predicted house-cleaning NTP pyrophosphatase (Maf/HAM1 superfamily)